LAIPSLSVSVMSSILTVQGVVSGISIDWRSV
jgi:hypothetical protein